MQKNKYAISHIQDNEPIKYVFDKWGSRLQNQELPIHIFGSSSKGNSIWLKPQRLLIDLAMSMKTYEAKAPMFFLNINTIIITHHHTDHLNPATLVSILKEYPHIHIYMPDVLYQHIISENYRPQYKPLLDDNNKKQYYTDPLGQKTNKVIYETDEDGEKIIEKLPYQNAFLEQKDRFILINTSDPQIDNQCYDITPHQNNYTTLFRPLTTKHGDIINLAIHLDCPLDNETILYASDLDNLSGETIFYDEQQQLKRVTGLKQQTTYTCLFLEANYDKDILDHYLETLEPTNPDYYRLKARASGNYRHISEQEAASYREKVLSENGIHIPLHASSQFGKLLQG